MTVNLTSKINAKLNELARDTARDQRFGASIVDIRANVIPQEMNPDIFTIRTVVRLDSSDLDLEFNGGGGKLLPQGGYTVTVDLPYRYKTHDGDNIFDAAGQGYDRLKAQLKAAFRAVAYNPEGDAETFPPPGTTITRLLLAGFKGNYGLENLGIDGEAVSQYAVQHRFGEHGRIQLSVGENRLKKIGGRPHFAINDLSLSGGAAVRNDAERGVQFEVDVLLPGNNEEARRQEKAERRLLAQTVRFNDDGIPQKIDYQVAEERSNAVRTARIAKQLDTSAGAGYSFGAIGLSAGYDKSIQTIFEARHSGAGRKAADDNLATWILAVEADDVHQRREIMGGLLGAKGTEGAAFHATSRNDDAVDLSARFGKTFGSSHVRLQMVAQFGELIKNCRTIKRSLQLSPDGESATFTYDALDGRQFITTLMDFDAGLKAQPDLKSTIHQHIDEMTDQIGNSFSIGNWLENLDLKEKVGGKLYDVVKESVERIALSSDATREHGKWGRVILKASGIRPAPGHDTLLAKMMTGDFADAVAGGLNLTTNTMTREDFKFEVKFDFAGLLSYAMLRSHGVIDEKKTWTFDGKKFQVREITGEAVKNVESLNTTYFQVRTYYVASVGEDGTSIPGAPTQAITTVVYTSKEKEVASDKEAGRLVGMAGALNFDTFVPFAPVRAAGLRASLLRFFRGIEPMGGGRIAIATATSTAGHIHALTRTPDEARTFGEDVAKAVLGLGDSPTPQLAAQAYDLGGTPESERLAIARFINKYFWIPGFGGFAAIGFNRRIDQYEIEKIRKNIRKRIDDPDGAEAQAEVDRIKTILPEGGVSSLPDGFILAAGASAILNAGLREPENEPSVARLTYEGTYHRKVKDEKFIRAMGQWAREIAEDSKVAAMRARLLRGEKPSDEEVLILLGEFMGMAAKSTQGSTAIFSDDKDMESLARWTILHAMAGEQNVIGMVRVQAELGSFAAGSSPDLTPAEIDKKWRELKNSVAAEEQRLNHEAHDR